MVDFTKAVKARIDRMSPDELAATEARRLSREAKQGRQVALVALCESPAGGGPAQTSEVTLCIDHPVAPGMAEILRVSRRSSFYESVVLTPPAYRLIAGGIADVADARAGTPERFTLGSGGHGVDRLTVDRAALFAMMEQERPVEAARARRLLDLEAQGPTRRSLAERVQTFEAQWRVEVLQRSIEGTVSKVSSRTLYLMAGRNRVVLWTRKSDFRAMPGILQSAMAAAVVRSRHRPARPIMTGQAALAEDAVAYLQNTFGTGPERRLVLDLAVLGNTLAALPSVEEQEAALALLRQLAERHLIIARQRRTRLAAARAAMSPHP